MYVGPMDKLSVVVVDEAGGGLLEAVVEGELPLPPRTEPKHRVESQESPKPPKSRWRRRNLKGRT